MGAGRQGAARMVELRASEVPRSSGPVGPGSRRTLFLPRRTRGDSGKAAVVRRKPSPVRGVVERGAKPWNPLSFRTVVTPTRRAKAVAGAADFGLFGDCP